MRKLLLIPQCKIFVFLDSISTALELGLFSNSYVDNNVIALLPKDYAYFKPSIGDFAKQALLKANNIEYIEYSAKRFNKYEKVKDRNVVIENLIRFKANKLPKEVSQVIDKKIVQNSISPFIINLRFFFQFSRHKEKFIYVISKEKLGIYINVKQLFFIINAYGVDKVNEAVLELFRTNACFDNKGLLKEYYKVKNGLLTYELKTYLNADIKVVINYIEEFINAIKRKEMGNGNTINLKYTRIWEWGNNRGTITFEDLLSLDLSVVNDYSLEKLFTKAVGSKHLVINGKVRKIEYYLPNREGYKLRKFHDELRVALSELIPLSASSYGYCEGKSAKMAISKHIGNKYFLKMDIKDFFNSISRFKMYKIIRILLSEDPYKNYENVFRWNKGLNFKSLITNWDSLQYILKFCFKNNRLPLGFTVSPLLSNLYLLQFDLRIEQKFKDIVYTRYADDILISSNNLAVLFFFLAKIYKE